MIEDAASFLANTVASTGTADEPIKCGKKDYKKEHDRDQPYVEHKSPLLYPVQQVILLYAQAAFMQGQTRPKAAPPPGRT